MAVIYILGVALLGSMLGSAVELTWQSFKSMRAERRSQELAGMIDGSQDFIAERYSRLAEEV